MNIGRQTSDALEHCIRKNEKNRKIKFDRRDKKIYFIIALVFTLYFAVCLSLVVFVPDVLTLPDLLIACTWTAIYPLMILVPALWIRFFDVCLYLKRLKRYGYMVPEDSRAYDRLLTRLPREDTGQKRKINDGVINTVVSAVITAGILWYCIWYRQEYQLESFYFFNGIGLCIWGFVTLRYALQISDKRYKADLELDDTRKTRESLMEAVMGIFFLLVISLFAILCIMELTRAAVKMI